MKKKTIFVLGATTTDKSKPAIGLAVEIGRAIYRGLDINGNKVKERNSRLHS